MTLVLLRTGVLAAALALVACSATGTQRESPMQARTIEAVLREHTRQLMSLPGVVGTAEGLCDGRPCIKVYVSAKTTGLERQIPAELEGYPVAVEETGELRPLQGGGDSPR